MSSQFPAVEGKQYIPYTALIPSWITQTRSITNNEAFKLVYHDEQTINHFRMTKQHLPREAIINNHSLINALNSHEPGPKIDYDLLQADITKLSPVYRHTNEELFGHTKSLLNLKKEYIERAIAFVCYDVWYNVARAYYEPNSDVPLAQLFPAPIDVYNKEAAEFHDPFWQEYLINDWIMYRDAAEFAAYEFFEMRDSQKNRDTLDYIHRVMTSIEQQEREALQRQRQIAADQHRERVRAARELNLAGGAHQASQLEKQVMPPDMVWSLCEASWEYNETLVDPNATVEQLEIDMAENGWTTYHPDEWASLHQAVAGIGTATATATATGSNLHNDNNSSNSN